MVGYCGQDKYIIQTHVISSESLLAGKTFDHRNAENRTAHFTLFNYQIQNSPEYLGDEWKPQSRVSQAKNKWSVQQYVSL